MREIYMAGHSVQTTLLNAAETVEGIPNFDELASSLLGLVDVIRDPVHGDIQITKLERCIIDQPAFQRLRNTTRNDVYRLSECGSYALHSLNWRAPRLQSVDCHLQCEGEHLRPVLRT
jgi:hypothetical protein